MSGKSSARSLRLPPLGEWRHVHLPAIRALSLREDPARVVSIAVPLAAGLTGIALAANAHLGIALMLALIYLPLAFVSLELAIVLWLPLAFLEAMPTFNLAVKTGGLLLVALWVTVLRQRREPVSEVISHNRPMWAALGGLLLWMTLSLLWAADRGEVLADLWHWYADAVLMLIIATTFGRSRSIRWLIAAFVLGSVVSVAQGIVSGGLSASSTAAADSEGRLAGGIGDPNFLAAVIVPAIVLSASLIPSARGMVARWALLGAVPVLAVGLAASESRGGLIAAIAATLAAVVVFKRQRGLVLVFAVTAITMIGAWFVISPSAWDRVTATENGGSGRSDLWAVAWRMVEDKPIFGVGLNNYTVVAGDYLQNSAGISRGDLIVDDREVVHNAYLQLLAETGIVGLALLLVLVSGSMRAAWGAVRRFEAAGQGSLELLTRGYIVAMSGLLAASFFISSGVDKRLWALLALGPALGAAAYRRDDLTVSGPLRLSSPVRQQPHRAGRSGDLQPEPS